MAASSLSSIIEWQTSGFRLCISTDEHGVACIEKFEPDGLPARPGSSPWFPSSSLPLTSIRSVGDGNTTVKTSKALIGSYLSNRVRYVSHAEGQGEATRRLDVVSRDEASGIQVTHHFEAYDGIPVLRSFATVENTSASSLPITQLSSVTIGGLTARSEKWWEDYSLMTCRNTWFREAQWSEQTISQAGIDHIGLYELRGECAASLATFSVSNRGSFSTGTFLPMGALKRHDGQDAWLWQIESSGSWRWEIGDFKDSVYVAVGGPTAIDHDWTVTLAPGETFTTVPVAVSRVSGSIDAAFGAMTAYRRRVVRPHQDHRDLPIIFNDYMNCLMGDPTEDKIKQLIPPVAQSGAEYFVIDAGWYADDSNWWDDVGLWEPSKKRFPAGFKTLLDTLRANGLTPGLWLEPEVVGVRSIVVEQLPEEAFFQQCGQRVIERGRFQLDYRHPAVRERMHAVIDRLVVEYGIGYFKFDYNIQVMSGSDVGGCNTGVAHLDHQRAYLTWVGEILDKYPRLVLETCSSGAQRMDYALLGTHTLQSTSDQQDPALYAAIAAAVPTAVIPEQSATWAYPQGEWSDETNAMCVVNSLLGRIHLSGRLDHLQPRQYDLIADGMRVYKEIRSLLKDALPFWPLGLPKWHDDWIALGMKTPGQDMLLSVWRRGGPVKYAIPFPCGGRSSTLYARLLYPSQLPATTSISGAVLNIELPNVPCARLFYVSSCEGNQETNRAV